MQSNACDDNWYYVAVDVMSQTQNGCNFCGCANC